MADERKWFYGRNGQQYGPVTTEDLRHFISNGQILPTDPVWTDGMADWVQARLVPEMMTTHSQTVPPPLSAIPIGYAMPQPVAPEQYDMGMRMLLPVGRSGWAIAAGYLGLFSVLLIFAPIAVIMSIIAILDLKKNPHKHGMGRAIFGLVMGILFSIGLCVVMFSVFMSKRF